MDHNYSIVYESVILLPLTETTSEQYRRLRNMESIRKWFVYSSEISRQKQQEWFQNYLKNENDIMFSIHLNNPEKTFVGANAIYHIQKDKKEGEYGRIVIMPQYTGRGAGYDATIGACVFAKKLGLKILVLEVYNNNETAIKMYEKVGFTYSASRYDENRKELLCMAKRL